MDRFSKLHPLLHTIFFVIVFVFVLSINNPIFSAVSLVSAVLYGVRMRGKEIWGTIKFSLVVLVTVSVFNMLFAHYGEDVLFTVGYTNFTLEALLYGFNQGMVLCSVMLWFGAFSRVMDSERVIYILRFSPKIALLFSMILGFIPRFTTKLNDIREAQLGLNSSNADKKKFRQALDNLSALISYCLESSIITADSMSARGYNPKAVRAGRYKYTVFDVALILIIIALSAVIIVEKIRGNISFIFDPYIELKSFSTCAIVSFSIINLIPLILDLWEDMLWKLSNAKA